MKHGTKQKTAMEAPITMNRQQHNNRLRTDSSINYWRLKCMLLDTIFFALDYAVVKTLKDILLPNLCKV